MRKTLLFISIAFLSTTNVFAQTERDTTTTTKIRVYSPNNSTTSDNNSYKWVVKTDVLAFLTGEFALAGEYRISKKFSVEASAGVTYPFLDNTLNLFGEDESYREGEAVLGSAFRGTIKYYPSSDYDAIEGWSFGIQLFTKTTNQEYLEYDTIDNTTDKKVKTGASLIIAKQLFQDSNVAFEFFIGVGLANVKRDYYEYIYFNETSAYQPVSTDKTAPNFQVGFKIGFGN